MESSTYSLWYIPSEDTDAYTTLHNTVQTLSKRFSCPYFIPHITLLPDIAGTEDEIRAKTKRICQGVKPFKVRLHLFDYTNNLYQTLVLRSELTAELRDSNKKARDVFNRHSDSLYAPHLSLLYKTGLENEVKQQLIEELTPGLLNLEFLVDTIYISTSGPDIEKWRIITSVKFN